MKRALFSALIAIAAAGCSPYIWDKQGVTAQDQQKDQMSCDRKAREATNYGPGFGHTHLRIETFKKCMTDNGYRERN